MSLPLPTANHFKVILHLTLTHPTTRYFLLDFRGEGIYFGQKFDSADHSILWGHVYGLPLSNSTWVDQDSTGDNCDIQPSSAINVTAGFTDRQIRIMMHTLHAMNEAMGPAGPTWAIHSRIGEGLEFRVILESTCKTLASAEHKRKQGVFTYCVAVPEVESISQIACRQGTGLRQSGNRWDI